MKRFICIILLLSLFCLSLPACSSGSENIDVDEKTSDSILEKFSGTEKWQTAVDYSDKNNWLAFEETPTKRADVLFFYPLSYSAAAGENEVCSIDNAQMRESAPQYLTTQAAVFTDECNLYAPFYRQIDLDFLLRMERVDRERVFEYAVTKDIEASLDYYFEHCNNGRPFILAGHDQGSDMVRYILALYLSKHEELKNRMIAAYAIGTPVTDSFLSKYHLKFVSGEDDTGVIVSYNTEGQGNYSYNQSEMIVRLHTKVINPLSWKISKPSVLESFHHGMLMEDGTIVPEVTSTHLNLDRGTVVCDNEDLQTYAMTGRDAQLYGPQCYHPYDYQFFFVNLKENVTVRVNAWFRKST